MRTKTAPKRYVPSVSIHRVPGLRAAPVDKLAQFFQLLKIYTPDGYKLYRSAVERLSAACDDYLVELFAEAHISAGYRTNAVDTSRTITIRDLRLAKKLINK